MSLLLLKIIKTMHKFGEKFTDLFQRYMPDAFVFAILLTLLVALLAFGWQGSSVFEIVDAWYKGFWLLLEFGMQIILILVTGFVVALSPIVKRNLDGVATWVNTPRRVYVSVILLGVGLNMISFGLCAITAVFARELAIRIKGVHYPFLFACAYLSSNAWVSGLSSSIPLLLNTEDNFLIKAGVLSETISTTQTLGSSLNLAMIAMYAIVPTLLIYFLAPKDKIVEIDDLKDGSQPVQNTSIEQEADSYHLPNSDSKMVPSDRMNGSVWLSGIVVLMGLTYIARHFMQNGFDLNFNIMIFIFLMLGMALHRTPMRFSIAMKRASSNVSGIIFQYLFYAGIMGIMMYTGLATNLAAVLATVGGETSYAFYSYLGGLSVNFAIPSAGGQFAVMGPTVIEAIKEIAAQNPDADVSAMIVRASMALAYGESLSNLMQPFFLLLLMPVMGVGLKIQARNILGYLVIPFVVLFVVQSLMVTFWPL